MWQRLLDVLNSMLSFVFSPLGGAVGVIAILALFLARWRSIVPAITRRLKSTQTPTTSKNRLVAAIPLAAGAWILSFDKLTANVTHSEYVDSFWEAAIWAVVIDYGLFVGWLALRKAIGRGWALAVVGAAATIWFQADITTPESWVPPLFLLLALWVLEAPVAAAEGGLDHEARYHEQVEARIALQAQLAEVMAERDRAQALSEHHGVTAGGWAGRCKIAEEKVQILRPAEEERNTLQIRVRQVEAEAASLREQLREARRSAEPRETPAPAPTGRTDSPAAPDTAPAVSSGGEAKQKLLSAWQNEPESEWTPAALADVAGVSRTSARRFLRDVVPSLNGRAQ